jgi:hypothetical protein
MGVLESIINLKQNEEAKRNAMWSNIVNAPMNYINAKNQAMMQGLEQQKTLMEIQKLSQPRSIVDDILKASTVSKNLIDIGESTGNKQLRDSGKNIMEQVLGQTPDPKNYLDPLVSKQTPSLNDIQLKQAQQASDLIPTSFNQFGEATKYESISATKKQGEIAASVEAEKASEKEKQVNATKVGRLSNLIDVIEKKYDETKTPSNPILRAGETFSRNLQLTNNQRTDKAYADFLGGVRAQLARAMGDVGNLSEYEQKAVMELVPTLLDDPKTAKIKIKNLRDFIKQVQTSAGIKGKGTEEKKNNDPLGIR